MTGAMADPFDAPHRSNPDDTAFHVDLAAYAGPLDLLLDLARRNKIDLMAIRILPLAQQYLDYVSTAKALRIDLAADVLVMAAWLAYLKSRLLCPAPDDGGPDGEELALDLAFRLRRLAAMRTAADALFARPRLGVHMFARGAPDEGTVVVHAEWSGSLHDLLTAYGSVRQGEIVRGTTLDKRPVFSLVDARRIMERLIGANGDWLPLAALVAAMPGHGETTRRGLLAATFGAALEMARERQLAIRQARAFGPLDVRATGRLVDG